MRIHTKTFFTSKEKEDTYSSQVNCINIIPLVSAMNSEPEIVVIQKSVCYQKFS